MSRFLSAWLAAAVVSSSACSSNPSGTLQLTTGPETDTFSQAPVPVSLDVTFVDSSGNTEALATNVPLPATSVDLGSLDESEAGILTISATDANGDIVVAGRTVPIDLSALDGETVPVFVQRTGELARMPNPFSVAMPDPLVGVVADRYVVLANGAGSTLYDLSGLTPISLTLPIVPTSLAFVSISGDPVGWLLNESEAVEYDISTSVTDNLVLPSGGSLADVSGGATVLADDGTQYIVGATRTTGNATAVVLELATDGTPTWLTLPTMRLGASATWVNNVGLVVAGGSASGAGADVIYLVTAPATTTGLPLTYPADPSVGSGATWLGGTEILVAGGALPDGSSAGVRVIDVACTSACVPAAWATLPATLTSAQSFAIIDSSVAIATAAMVVGTDASSGLARAFRVTATDAAEVLTKEPLTGTRAIGSPIGPLGSFLLLGGTTIESFTP